MAVRLLTAPMQVWRIGDPEGRFPIFSGDGAALIDGRWHRKGQHVIYASEHYSTAMLEKLAHWSGLLPSGQHFIKITIPVDSSYEVVTRDSLRGWDDPDSRVAREYGASWIDECRTLILIVPSVVAREESNILINPAHNSFSAVSPSLEKPVRWDNRLFP